MKVSNPWVRSILWAAAVACGLLVIRFILPLSLPFLVGLAAALCAEPLTKLLSKKLPRALAAGVSMAAVYGAICAGVYFAGRQLLLELNRLTGQLPELAEGAGRLVTQAQTWLYGLAEEAPENLRLQMRQGIDELMGSGADLAQSAAATILSAASRMILRLPDTLIFLVTTITSGFLISAKLPRLRPWLRDRLPARWRKRVGALLANVKQNLGGWLRAQCKLVGLTFCILLAGFFILRVNHPVVTAVVVTLVDALPVLGVGTVLLPWAAVALLQGGTALAIGLSSLYAVTVLARSALEPRLVGRQLGLSPLVTLAAIYIGFQLWGVMGMILAPIFVITAGELRRLLRLEKWN